MAQCHQHDKNSCDCTQSSHESQSECKENNCYSKRTAAIICPIFTKKEKYESSLESYSDCSDLNALCDNRKRKKCSKTDSAQSFQSSSDCNSSQSNNSSSDCNSSQSNDSSSINSNSSCDSSSDDCCNNECDDYSKKSVLKSLKVTGDNSRCSDLTYLTLNVKRNCKKTKKSNPTLNNKSQDCDNKSKDWNKKPLNIETKIVSLENKILSALDNNLVENSGTINKNKKFHIKMGPKKSHKWSHYNKNDNSIYINEKNGPVLHLYVGGTYFFCVDETTKCDFILTDSPVGGPKSTIITSNFRIVSKGCVSLKINETTPRYFYYQSATHKYQGGLVIVHDN